MKFGIVSKSLINIDNDLQLINRFTRKELKAEDVYTFPVILCDNEVDRDYEHFSVECLNDLSKMFIGKTIISDHSPKNENQKARIYDTTVETDNTKTTKLGEPYTYILAKVYMLNSEKNKDLIDNIDAGIIKEVSVGCSISKKTCSICGKDFIQSKCSHRKGKTYKDKLCVVTLSEPTDAYEVSFVAVPAQPNAGVIKHYNESEERFLMEIINKLKTFNIEIDEKASETDIIDTIEKNWDTITKAEDVNVIENEDGSKSVIKGETEIAKVEPKVIEKEVVKEVVDETLKEKAKWYDEIKKSVIEEALKNGIKAKGDSFNKDRWGKAFDSFSIDEIKAQSEEWLEEAKKELNAGVHKTQFEITNTTVKKVNYNF